MDPQRFEELYREYWGYVFTICRRVLGNIDDALEAAQEVFVRAWEAKDDYDPARLPFKAWLSVIANRLCIDILRSKSRKPEVEPMPDDVPAAPPAGGNVVTNLALSSCLSRLDPLDCQLVLMKLVEGYTWEEIVAMTDLSVSQARTRVAHATKCLGDCLAEHGIER